MSNKPSERRTRTRTSGADATAPATSTRHGDTGLGVLEASGADARSFLHRQLSTNMINLSTGDCRLSSWSDARGRLQAVVHVIALEDDRFLLILPAERVPALATAMARYVLRDRAVLHDATDDWSLTGMTGAPPANPPPGVHLVRLAGEPERWLLLAPTGDAEAIGTTADMPEADGERWRLQGIRAGIPVIHEATVGRFTAQMVNLDLLAAVDFDKGCYPGQEIIARAHYLGRSKRRMFILFGEGTRIPEPGTALHPHGDRETEPVGEIVEATRSEPGHWLATAVLRLQAIDNAPNPAGRDSVIRVTPPPYPLDQD